MIISIKTVKNGKIKIYADGEEYFTVPAVIWYSSSFREGDDVDEKDLLCLKMAGEASFAFDSGMRLLSLRMHSEYELKHKLTLKFSKEASESAMERLKQLGLIDDEKFAVMYAEELSRRKGFSSKKILMELKNRGIDGNYAQNAVNALDIDPEISIIRVIEKCGLTENSTDKEKNRVIRRLINMGYSYGDISKYINFND